LLLASLVRGSDTLILFVSLTQKEKKRKKEKVKEKRKKEKKEKGKIKQKGKGRRSVIGHGGLCGNEPTRLARPPARVTGGLLQP
jgi:hypothetical protein